MKTNYVYYVTPMLFITPIVPNKKLGAHLCGPRTLKNKKT